MTPIADGVAADRDPRGSAEPNRPRRLRLAGQFAHYVQFVRYGLCAGLATLTNFAAGTLLVDGCGFTSAWRFPLAVAVAYALGMVVNFVLNRTYTFASDRRGVDQARTFIVVALSGLALTTFIAALARPALALVLTGGGAFAFLPAPLGTPETTSRALAIALASLYSFTAHKHFTFNRGIRLPLLRLVRSLQFGG